MKKVIIISLFVLGLIIPNIDVKAVNVSNEEELRAAIEQGGDITLTKDIEVKEPLVIDKDVNIRGRRIMMQGDDTLMTINSGNVILDRVNLYAGWNGVSDYPYNVIKNQGKAIVINGGTLNLKKYGFNQYVIINAGNVGIEVNNGTITGVPYIYAGEKTEDDTYSGGQGMIVNGGKIESTGFAIFSGETALTVNNSSNITLNVNDYRINMNSYEGNGIEINDGSMVNFNSKYEVSNIHGLQNAIYLNGGTINLSGFVELTSGSVGYEIYINKGINTSNKGDILNFKDDLKLRTYYDYSAYVEGYYIENPNIYINPDITELRVTDEKNFFKYENNKLKFYFCSNNKSNSNKENDSTCNNLDAYYDGPIESNELGKHMTVYINKIKQNEVDASSNSITNTEEKGQNPQVVGVPSTSAYGSIIIAVLGIVCVIVSVFVMKKITNKTN